LPAPDVTGITVEMLSTTYCSLDGGVEVGLSNGEIDVTYTIFDASGVEVASFTPTAVGPFTIATIPAGTYRIEASRSGECVIEIASGILIIEEPSPVIYELTGPATGCAESIVLNLSGSEVGVLYQLYSDAMMAPGNDDGYVSGYDTVGTGGPLTFNLSGFPTGASFFWVKATYTGGCSSSTEWEAVNVRQAASAFEVVLPDSAYCAIEQGVTVGISVSDIGVGYQLILAGNTVAFVDGNGNAVEFAMPVEAGTYFVRARNFDSGCFFDSESFTITEEASPVVYELTVPSSGCASSIELNLAGSEAGVLYQLYSDAFIVPGNDEGYVSGYDTIGTGAPITFDLTGFVSGASFFWIRATYTGGCSIDTEWLAVNIKDAASAFEVELPLGNEYCASEPGVTVGVSITDNGVGYLLFKDGSTVDFLSGNGSAQQFGLPHGDGDYFVQARNFNSGCSFDSPSFTIIKHNMPAIFDLSNGGSVNVHEITLDGSEVNVAYYLYLNDLIVDQDSLVGSITGDPLNFGTVSTSGFYSVVGVGVGGCSSRMNGTSVIFETPLVAIVDTLYLGEGELVGSVNLGLNDHILPGVDILNVNVSFSFSDDEPYGTVTLDPVSGMLIYEKLPSFYGKDSLTYIIQNTEIPSRISSAKVYIMVGNKDFDDNLSFLLPNAFSPNGDDLNENFVITGLGDTEESNLEVFNRWGTIVFRSTGTVYENNWDGHSNIGSMVSIGSELPNGTYYYIFEVKKNVEGKVVTRRYNGFVELRR
jgi:gliding motility-associated-like protein